ncbi:hypothetical protein EJH19_25590, partial [Salmonella enterica subsp. enterica serovar Vitkin]|nr:hypothetical protein [Salmonella enterica subsp. enterica serovar Vitkin]
TVHVIPDTVRVCADIRDAAGPQRCGGQFNPVSHPGAVWDLTMEAQVAVDIPKLTVYLAPLYGQWNGRFDGASRGTDDNVAVYHSMCQALSDPSYSPKIALENGTVYKYAYTRNSDMATTRLTGSASVPSDFNYEPGQRFVEKDWPGITDTLQTPATWPVALAIGDGPAGWAKGGWSASINL